MKKLIILFFSLFSSVIIAENNNAPPAVTPKTDIPSVEEGQYVPPNTALIQDFCPPIETLVRNPVDQIWSAPNGWKAPTPSFLRTVDAFVGAQWVGVSVGEVICVYTKAAKSNTFPVTLQRSRLVPAPKPGEFWSEDKGGFMECKSNNVKNCPFFVQVPKAPENIYEQLNFHKDKPVNEY